MSTVPVGVVALVGECRRRAAVVDQRIWLGLLLVAGLVIRIWNEPAGAGHNYDVDIFNAWARTMRDHPLDDFYAIAPSPDHLPGDLWMLNGLQGAWTSLGLGGLGDGFNMLVRVFPVAADLVCMLAAYALLRRVGGAGIWAVAWIALCPAFFDVSAAWGQWDSVSAALVLVGAWLVVRGGWSLLLGGPVLTWAVLVKPQLAIPVVAFGLVAVVAEVGRRRWWPLIGGALASVGWACALLLPFNVGLLWTPSGGWSLSDRVTYAADMWPVIRMNAANIWSFAPHPQPVISPETNDANTLVAGLSYAQVGTLAAALVALVVLAGVVRLWRARLAPAVIAAWASGAMLLGAFFFMTRVHERYEYPVVVCVLLLACLARDWRTWGLLVATVGVTHANLLIALHAKSIVPARIDAVAEGIVLLALLSWPLWHRRGVMSYGSPA